MIVGEGPETVLPRIGTKVPAHFYREILFLPERNFVLEKYTGAKLDAAATDAAAKAGVDAVMPMRELPGVLAQFAEADRRRLQTFWWQTDFEAGNAVMRFLGASMGNDAAPAAHDVRALTMPLRSIKSPSEIALLKKASDASMKAQLVGMKAIKPGTRKSVLRSCGLYQMRGSTEIRGVIPDPGNVVKPCICTALNSPINVWA